MHTIHHRCADIGSQQLSYRESSPSGAPALVVLHGFPASSFTLEAFADSAQESGPRAGAGPWPVVRPRLPAEQTSGSPAGLMTTDVKRDDRYDDDHQ
jgi:hypothetical protein